MKSDVTERFIDATGRLRGKVAIVTGGAGNIGREICLRFLREGAAVALVGRDVDRLSAAQAALREATGVDHANILPVACDGANPGQTRSAVERVLEHFGKLDVLVNNAGSVGPRQRIGDLPISRAELDTLRAAGATDIETVGEAARNIFGISWNMVRAAAPHLKPGASIINVSTIFSRTKYFGRAAYVVPKAALNTWSRRLSYELGNAGIRVNTVLPGPIESDRISSVFATMDRLRNAPGGTTADEIFEMMTLSRTDGELPLSRTYPTIADVSNSVVFLASDDSAAINGHNFEITHGMVVHAESRSTFVSRPGLRIVDAGGSTLIVIAGDQVRDALEIARVHASRNAEVIIGFDSPAAVTAAHNALSPFGSDRAISTLRFDRSDPAAMAGLLQSLGNRVASAVVLPAHGPERFRSALADCGDAEAAAFIDDELVGSLRIARELTRHWKGRDANRSRRVTFLSNGDDGRGNVYADILRAAQEQLARVWRDETQLDSENGLRPAGEWVNQIVRWTNAEDESLRFAAAWSAKLLHGKRKVKSVNLYLPESLEEDTGARRAVFGESESLIGLHLGKVALITGGSAGIGAQIGRLLAIAGARVVLVARDRDKLESTRGEIVAELEAIGYDGAAQRIEILDGIDVADEASLARSVERAMERFGRIDYLINNAGVTGAEQMIVDIPLDAWRKTLRANLTSNFSLMARVVPEMKRNGGGYIVNVSSYFGGEKYVAVSYPNRADYAVSKAGQRALVEQLAAFVGPAIQLNAIAPGPVDGGRLRGALGPGLFERRGRLILENQRLNAVHAAVIQSIRDGVDAAAFVKAALANDVVRIAQDPATPPRLRALCAKIIEEKPTDAECSAFDFLMNATIAEKFVERLVRGGYLRSAAPALATIPADPYFPARDVARNAEKIRSSVLKLLHLQKMPTETEVALATVYFLADRAISGDTFHPSGGLKQERSITERELFGRSRVERIEHLRGRTVWIIGEHSVAAMSKAATAYLDECHVETVVLMTRTKQAADFVLKALRPQHAAKIKARPIGMDIESGLSSALAEFEKPVAVLSMPMGLLPVTIFEDDGGMSGADFEQLLEEHITNHFRVARVASLLDDVRLIFVTPDLAIGANAAEFALASFVKTTLHALTATAAVENERLVHEVPVNQINAIRQVQSDEPRNTTEQEERLERFARAVILESGPLPRAEESRYRAKIYRGVAITV